MEKIPNFVHSVDMNLSPDDGNKYFKEKFSIMVKNFDVEIGKLPYLLGIPSDKVMSVLQDKPCSFSDKELERLNYRLPFLTLGFTIINSKDRVRTVINSILVDEYHLSYETLARYAGVPSNVIRDFCNDKDDIGVDYLINICVNLQMMSFILRP